MPMEPEIIATFAQFGTAGLIAGMWLVERRSAAERERQVAGAHERLMEQRTHIDTLLRVVADNTRAVAALEAGLRSLAGSLGGTRAACGGATPEGRPTRGGVE